MPSLVDFSQAQPDPNIGERAYDYANKMYQYAAKRRAGQQYAAGDYSGAGSTLARAGDIAGAETLADKQLTRIQKQQDVLGRVGSFLEDAGKDPTTNPAEAWQWGARTLHAVGVEPETISQLQQGYATNPKLTIAKMKALAAHKYTYEKYGDQLAQFDENGNMVHMFGDNKPFRGNDLTAQALNIVLDPKADPSARRAAEAVLSQGSTTATAAGILSKPGLGTSWLGASGGGAAPAQTGDAASAPAAPMPPPQRTPQATPPSAPAVPSKDDQEIWENMNPGGGAISIDANGNYWRNTTNGPVPVTNDDGSQVQARAGGTVAPSVPAGAPVTTPAPAGPQAASPPAIRLPGGAMVTPLPQPETYGQPVPGIVDGKPAMVRYPNRGGQPQVVPGVTPVPPASQSTAPTRQQIGLAKQKLTYVDAIDKQLARVQTAMEDAEKNGWTGIVGGHVPGGLDTPSDVFDKSVALLAALIRQLTRVQGEGSMSDYETRLATMTLPSRTDTAGGRREALAGITALTKEIKDGYSELLSGTAPSPSPSGQTGGRRTIGRFQVEEGP